MTEGGNEQMNKQTNRKSTHRLRPTILGWVKTWQRRRLRKRNMDQPSYIVSGLINVKHIYLEMFQIWNLELNNCAWCCEIVAKSSQPTSERSSIKLLNQFVKCQTIFEMGSNDLSPYTFRSGLLFWKGPPKGFKTKYFWTYFLPREGLIRSIKIYLNICNLAWGCPNLNKNYWWNRFF